jgi:hypothetical protein
MPLKNLVIGQRPSALTPKLKMSACRSILLFLVTVKTSGAMWVIVPTRPKRPSATPAATQVTQNITQMVTHVSHTCHNPSGAYDSVLRACQPALEWGVGRRWQLFYEASYLLLQHASTQRQWVSGDSHVLCTFAQ